MHEETTAENTREFTTSEIEETDRGLQNFFRTHIISAGESLIWDFAPGAQMMHSPLSYLESVYTKGPVGEGIPNLEYTGGTRTNITPSVGVVYETRMDAGPGELLTSFINLPPEIAQEACLLASKEAIEEVLKKPQEMLLAGSATPTSPFELYKAGLRGKLHVVDIGQPPLKIIQEIYVPLLRTHGLETTTEQADLMNYPREYSDLGKLSIIGVDILGHYLTDREIFENLSGIAYHCLNHEGLLIIRDMAEAESEKKGKRDVGKTIEIPQDFIEWAKSWCGVQITPEAYKYYRESRWADPIHEPRALSIEELYGYALWTPDSRFTEIGRIHTCQESTARYPNRFFLTLLMKKKDTKAK